MKLLGQCCGPCVTPSSGCVNEGCEVFSYEGAMINANGYLPWSEPRPSVTDSTGPIVVIVKRTPQNQVAVGRYDCDGNYVCTVTKNCPYRAFFSPQDVSITNGVILFTIEGHDYYANTLTEEFFEKASPAAMYGMPWRKIGTLAATTNAVNGDFLYLAFASGADGDDFTDTYDPDLDFIAVLRSPTPLTPAEEDFAGLFTRYTPNSAAVEVLDGEFFRAKAAHIVIHCDPAHIPAGCPFTDHEWAIGAIELPPLVGAVITYPDFGQKGATIDWRVVRDNSCGCSHLFGQPSGTLTFAPGEWRKRIEIPVEDHDAPKWWGCPGNYPGGLMYGYEAGAIIIENLVPDGFCASIGGDTFLIWVYCEHADGPPLNYTVESKEINSLFTGAGGFQSFEATCVSGLGDGYYLGLWDAGANRTRLESGGIWYINNENQAGLPMQAVAGQYFRVAAIGENYTLDGESGWGVGDLVYFNGATWELKPPDFADGGKYLLDSWRKYDMTGYHLEEQPQGSGNFVTVSDSLLVHYWQRQYGYTKEESVVSGAGDGWHSWPCDSYSSPPYEVTASVSETSQSYTVTNAGTPEDHGERTLSEKNSDAEDIAIAEALLAHGDFGDPATLGGVWGIQPGDAVPAPAGTDSGTDEREADSDAFFDDYGFLPLGIGYANLGILNDWTGGGTRVAAARARWIDSETGRKTYAMRRKEITVSWNNAQKPYILTHVYIHVGYARLGDASGVSGGYTAELTNGVPHIVEPPPEWGCVALIGFSSESEFVCHPGQAP